MMDAAKTAISITCKECDVRCQSIGVHRNGLRRFRCPKCRKSYTEPHRRTLDTMYIPQAKAMLALQLLLEGNSLRSTQRITGLDVNTIMSLLLKAGERCQKLMYDKMQNLRLPYLQCDEIWCFVGKKDRRVRKDDSPELGSQWIFVAIDEQSKLVPHFEIGKRTRETTEQFLNGLRWTLSEDHLQITTDGYTFYRSIQSVFAGRVDFAQLVKLYGDHGQERGPEARYSPSGLTEVISKVVDGNPDPEHISTSFIERSNFDDAYADAQTDAPDTQFQQEPETSSRCYLPAFRLLQFLPNAQINSRYALHGSWNHGSCLDDYRTPELVLRGPNINSDNKWAQCS